MSPAVLLELHQQLIRMRDCKGEHCTHYHGKKYPQHTTSPTVPTEEKSHTHESVGKTKASSAVILTPSLPTNVKTSSESSASPLTSKNPSGDLVNGSNVVVNKPESSEVLAFTTSVPTEATEELSTTQSTEMINVQTSENREREEKEETFAEKQTQQYVSTTKRSPLPTQNPKRTTVSDKISESQQSSKRRKNGKNRKREKVASVDKQTQKITKKSRKSKKKSSIRETSLVPTENTKELKVSENHTIAPDRASESGKNVSNHFGEIVEKDRPGKNQISSEKPSQKSTTPMASSGDVPKKPVLVRSSESGTSPSETNVSSILPTSASTTTTKVEENTSGVNLKVHFTVKPTGGKSSKRRKNGEREDNSLGKETPETSKELRKTKKKLSEKQIPLTALNSGSLPTSKQSIKTAENQTLMESRESGSELENKGNENGNASLPHISRKRNKKPASKRSSNRNSKRRSKQRPPKRQRPTQSSEGGVAEDGAEPLVVNGTGLPYEQTYSPSEP